MSITIEELEKIMVEKGISIRAIPLKIVEHWTIRDKDIPNCENEIVYIKGKAFEEKIKIPEHGGKFMIVENCNTYQMVNFKKWNKDFTGPEKNLYFDSIEDAIKSIQQPLFFDHVIRLI
jgi:hypothetical protein